VDYINEASDAVPDGRLVHATLSPDGRTVTFQNKDLDGRVIWQQTGAAHAVLERATSMGKDGKLQWNALESQAAKYDNTFAQMQKARQGNAVAGAKEDAANASAERVAGAVGNLTLQPVTRVSNAAPTPALPGPGTNANVGQRTDTTPAVTPAAATSPTTGAPPSPNSAGAAQPNAAPQGADSNATYQPSNLGGAPTQAGPAIPPQATPAPSANVPANTPTSGAQDVSFEDIAHRLDQQEAQVTQSDAAQIHSRYFNPQNNNVIVGGQEYARPPEPNLQGLTRQEQQQAVQAYNNNDAVRRYNDYVKSNTDQMNKDIADNKDLRSKEFQARRDQAGRQFTEGQANTRAAHSDAAAATLETNRQADAERKQQESWAHEEQKPLSPEESNKRFAEHPATSFLASSPATAVYKNDGTLDENASAQALGKMFDLNDRGGLRRVDTLSTALTNAQTYNPHVSPQQLGTTLTNMANGTYGYRAKTQPVDYGYGPMRQVEVFRGKVGQGTPTRLLIPADDYDAVDGIKGEFVNAQPKPTAAAPAAPAGPAAPAIPRTPYKPLIQSRPGEESGIRMPQWVPPEQIPPEQRQLYPELNR
jgi:hypothetical protein